MYKLLIGLVVVLVVGGLGYIYLFPAPVPTTQERVTEVPVAPVIQNTETVGTRTVAVTGSEFSFTPKEVRMKVGETVMFLFTNEGAYPHNLIIQELGLTSATVQKGESTNLEFTATKPGTYKMHCGIGNHEAQGMVGTLIVE
jgi:plastocyanin